MPKITFVSFVVGLSILLAACGGNSTPVVDNNSVNINVTFETRPSPMMMGNGEVILTITDSNGNPIEGAVVDISMEHTGHNMGTMQGTATEQGNGRYAINAGFSMSGTWKLTVNVKKDDLNYTEEIEIPVQ
ncbi:MAG TPA: hypothetical protein DIW23_12730 [Anaerolineae bacterium]|nr:hypothetical protein [Anaerolineae bacterium]